MGGDLRHQVDLAEGLFSLQSLQSLQSPRVPGADDDDVDIWAAAPTATAGPTASATDSL